MAEAKEVAQFANNYKEAKKVGVNGGGKTGVKYGVKCGVNFGLRGVVGGLVGRFGGVSACAVRA